MSKIKKIATLTAFMSLLTICAVLVGCSKAALDTPQTSAPSETVIPSTTAPPEDVTISDSIELPTEPLMFPAVQTGDIIQLGGYSWRVLEVQGGKAFIISDRVIDRAAYQIGGGNSTWETCTLRAYLNNEFYEQFRENEKEIILETNVANEDNVWFKTNGGNDTSDKIFLLSLGEVVKYFGDSGRLDKRPSSNTSTIDDKYNGARIALDINGDDNSWKAWWLRSPGNESNYASCVSYIGKVYVIGYHTGVDSGVRPVMWIKIAEEQDLEEETGVLPDYQSYPPGVVADYANILGDGYSNKAGEYLFPWIEGVSNTIFDSLNRSRLYVVTTPSLDGMSCDTYAELLLSTWMKGRTKDNYSMLLLLAPNDGEAAFACGYELKNTLVADITTEWFNSPFGGGESSFRDYFNSGDYIEAVGTFIDHLEDDWLYDYLDRAKDSAETIVTPFSIREGYAEDAASIPAIITEKEVVSVETGSDADIGNYVKLTFNESGKSTFAEATGRLAGNGTMSVWIGDTVMMNPSVGGQIVNGEVLLMCDTKEQADYLAKQIRHAAGLQ